MTKYYIVTETEYQYNDEYHYCDSNGGTPIKVFNNKEDADKFARDKSIEWLKDVDIDSYMGYDLESMFDRVPKCIKMNERKFWKTINESEYGGVNDILKIETRSDKELEEILECINLEPYAVHTVE